MVRITRVYTKKGDKGYTRTSPKTTLSKDSATVRLLGLLDELNSVLGWCRIKDEEFAEIDQCLAEVQNTLFDIGALVTKATDENRNEKSSTFKQHLSHWVTLFEQDIDQWNLSLPALNSFILPGGPEAASRLHIARTVCRRAECEAVEVNKISNIADILPYINRFSDWLFVAGRFISHQLKFEEQLWHPF